MKEIRVDIRSLIAIVAWILGGVYLMTNYNPVSKNTQYAWLVIGLLIILFDKINYSFD